MPVTLARETVPLSAYTHFSIRDRMKAVAAKRPDLTISRQIGEAIERLLPELEQRAGVKRPTTGAKKP